MILQRMNWGWRIAMVYGAFVAFMLFMVYQSTQMKTELVTPDYYAEELRYQNHIDKLNRTAQLPSALEWVVKDAQIEFRFPPEVAGAPVSAEVYFYCPGNSRNDVRMKLATNNGVAQLSVGSLKPAAYVMKVDWKAGGIEYYNEGAINIR